MLHYVTNRGVSGEQTWFAASATVPSHDDNSIITNKEACKSIERTIMFPLDSTESGISRRY